MKNRNNDFNILNSVVILIQLLKLFFQFLVATTIDYVQCNDGGGKFDVSGSRLVPGAFDEVRDARITTCVRHRTG